jgi:hypothetical protein
MALLEGVTAVVLVATLAALGAVVAAALLGLPAADWQVWAVVGLLATCLLLVGLTALGHTRP